MNQIKIRKERETTILCLLAFLSAGFSAISLFREFTRGNNAGSVANSYLPALLFLSLVVLAMAFVALIKRRRPLAFIALGLSGLSLLLYIEVIS